MPVMKTPGVYIVEKNAFSNSVVEVATAVPAFIGYTERADDRGKSLAGKPWRISSMNEFNQYFGGPPKARFDIVQVSGPVAAQPTAGASPAPAAGAGPAAPAAEAAPAEFVIANKGYRLTQNAGLFNLYRGMLHFFQNGGGACFVVSAGQYGQVEGGPPAATAVERGPLEAAIAALELEQEPTMLVIPDAVLLGRDHCVGLQQAMLKHCGLTMRNRVAILDVWGGDQLLKDKPVDNFRSLLGVDFLDFGAAYYPFVHTSLVQDRDLDFGAVNGDSVAALQQCIRDDLGLGAAEPSEPRPKLQWKAVNELSRDWHQAYLDSEPKPAATPAAAEKAEKDWIATSKSLLQSALVSASEGYRNIMGAMKAQLNLMPPSPAMAGLYCMVDNTRGVWKAPANVTVASAVRPAVTITHADQQDLNVHTSGKSINVIRAFIGEGVLVWGARTLDGNSLDWRYINVRRTMIMLEESCRLAARALVFEPNAGGTWVSIKSMIQNFLTGIWKRGGLAGAVPEDAFSVHCGLGETMTPEDILEGILRVTVLVAVSRPAEFIEITFQQQMQQS